MLGTYMTKVPMRLLTLSCLNHIGCGYFSLPTDALLSICHVFQKAAQRTFTRCAGCPDACRVAGHIAAAVTHQMALKGIAKGDIALSITKLRFSQLYQSSAC